MAVTVAALNATHFLLAGEEHPRGWTVVAYGTQDALMKKVGYRDKRVSIRSTVGGSVRADQAALIEALTAIVSVPEGSGGGEVDPVAVGAAVNEAIRDGGALPVDTAPAAIPTDPIDVTVTNTWAALPSTACTRFELLNERWPVDEIPIRYRRGSGGAARVQPAGKADTIDVAANASEIQVSRADGVATGIVVQLQVLA